MPSTSGVKWLFDLIPWMPQRSVKKLLESNWSSGPFFDTVGKIEDCQTSQPTTQFCILQYTNKTWQLKCPFLRRVFLFCLFNTLGLLIQFLIVLKYFLKAYFGNSKTLKNNDSPSQKEVKKCCFYVRACKPMRGSQK